MDIYSPSAKRSETFRKNTYWKAATPTIPKTEIEKKEPVKRKIKKSNEIIMRNGKIILAGSSVEYVLKEEQMNEEDFEIKRNPITSLLDFLKLKFIDRMKVFFDYDDKYEERGIKNTWQDRSGKHY